MPVLAEPLPLSKQQRADLNEIAQSRSLPAGFVFGAKLILMLAEGSPRVTKPLSCSDVYILRSQSMPKTDSLQGSLDLLVLKILSRRPRLHGYAIMTAIQDISGEVLRAEEGSLYPALHRMEEAGWIRAEWITKTTGRRARIYELTVSGKQQLAAEESRWQAVTSAVNRVLKMA